jgi:hypothetical protein
VRSSNGRRPTRSVSLPNIGAAMSDRNIGMATRLPATCQRTGRTYLLCARALLAVRGRDELPRRGDGVVWEGGWVGGRVGGREGGREGGGGSNIL